MRRISKYLVTLAAGVFAACLSCSQVQAKTTDNGSVIFDVNVADSFDQEQGLTYARVVCMKHTASANGTLLATCDQHVWVDKEQVWPIYRSTDNGESWTHISDVRDTKFGTNRKAQPMLFELPVDVGGLKEGTLLLAGNLVPDDESSSRIVLYQSTDLGSTWSYLSTVDTGGPFDYDPSTTSTTTTIWEPYLYVDKYNHLVCGFSDERQKGAGALQSLSLRYTSDGIHWSDEKNIVSIGNKNDRPGMVTVSRLPNGKFIASYEVVNRPSYNQNSSVVYYKFSDDGLNWNPGDLGILAETEDGQHLGSSPYVKWVNAGGPEGTVILGGKWVVNQNGDIQEGGQNVFVNYHLGQGKWERLPQALTWNGEDITYLDAFSQCLETNVDDTVLYQIANIGNPKAKKSELRIGTLPLNMDIYEAENATITNAKLITCEDSSNRQEIGNINYSDSKVLFEHIVAPAKGTYRLMIRYNNGTGMNSSHNLYVNNQLTTKVNYTPTADWHQYGWAEADVYLNTGSNTIALGYDQGYAELDCVALSKKGIDMSNSFMLENRNSSKYLEIPDMSTELGKGAAQYSMTHFPCQVWRITKTDGGYKLINKNSFRALGIEGNAPADGAKAVQQKEIANPFQNWKFESTDSGYAHLINQGSGKYLEVMNNETSDSAVIDQWGPTGYGCQEWIIKKEGIQ